jgi:pimeloyl-ACP methyl ester carboxylesterase
MISRRRFLFLILFIIASPANGAANTQVSNGQAYQQSHFNVLTVDRVAIRGAAYSAANDKVIIYGHRLLREAGDEEIEHLLETFIDEYDLFTFEFRGHESSFGASTIGGDEILDLRAVISFAKSKGYEKIIVVGAGMGGTVGARTALIFHNIDALVVISPSGFLPRFSPLPVKLLTDIALDSPFGKIPLRIVTNTRLGQRYAAGFPVDLLSSRPQVPTLIIHSQEDRFVSLNKMLATFEGLFEPEELMIVPGRRHAEKLIRPDNLRKIDTFLMEQFGPEQRTDSITSRLNSNVDMSGMQLIGDLPMPERIILDEVHDRISAGNKPGRKHSQSSEKIISHLAEVLAFHGYTHASISVADSISSLRLRIDVPKIRSVVIEGNRWVDESYVRDILKVGGDHFNTYELDAAVRRASSHPAIQTVIPTVATRDDGDVDIRTIIVERKPYRFLLATKFTDFDKFFGVGVTWNEFNPTAFQYEGMGALGVLHYDFLTSHRLSKNLFANHLRLSLAYNDVVKSRDDLDYVFTRQEVRERGGEFSIFYRISSGVAVQLDAFGKEYLSPEISLDNPVSTGENGGAAVKVNLSGKLPFQGPPILNWLHTFYYQKAGPRGVGDFYFDTYQFNLETRLTFFEHNMARTTFHGGWIAGKAPPQEHLSLGGMHTFPGYPDDEFVNTRMMLFSQGVFLSMHNFVNETSVWAPLRWIVSFHAGTAWGAEEKFRMSDVRTDVVLEFDYMETLRAGVAFPTGGLRTGSPRIYIGWGEHVF